MAATACCSCRLKATRKTPRATTTASTLYQPYGRLTPTVRPPPVLAARATFLFDDALPMSARTLDYRQRCPPPDDCHLRFPAFSSRGDKADSPERQRSSPVRPLRSAPEVSP